MVRFPAVEVEFIEHTIGVVMPDGTERCFEAGERAELPAQVAWNLVGEGLAILTQMEATYE